jgi:hypothetical protein
LEDEAGHVGEPGEASAVLRLDTEPPVLNFVPRDPRDPARIVVETVDAASGVAEVTIEARRRGENVWHALDVEGKEHAVALLDDDALAAGMYEVRARAVDAVGNERSISTWPSGGSVEVQLPLRTGTKIAAGVPAARGKKTAAKLDSRPLVRFGAAITLRGKVADDHGRARAAVPVQVSERPTTPGASWQPVATVMTGKTGDFDYRAPRGATRNVRFLYAGSPTSRAASAEVTLRVPAKTTLTASRRRLRNGETVVLRGALKGGPIPEAGKLLTLQARIPGGWRTFGTPRARAKDGRWSYRYTFTRTPATARYTFRVVVPHEESFPYVTGTSRALKVVVLGSQ